MPTLLAKQIADYNANQASLGPEPAPLAPAEVGAMQPAASTMAKLPVMAQPKVSGPDEGQQQINNDQAQLQKVQWHQAHPWGTPENHPGTLGKIAHVLSVAGNIAGNIVAPATMSLIPGTQLNMQDKEQGLAHRLNEEISDESQNQSRDAETANALQKPILAQEKQDETATNHKAQIEQHLRASGFKTDETGEIVPLPYEEMSEQQQAVHDLKASQDELAQAGAQLKRFQADPNSPAAKIAQQRLDGAQQARQIALQRLGLSQQVFNARYHGTDGNGQALPGAMVTENGEPVGSSFSQNVRPTGTERNKADMAASAAEQLSDIKQIVKKHPQLFGPGYGQASAFRQWIGSEDPDAQRFIAARTIAGDHLAGTFGGRSEAALDALDKAIGRFKDNPAAMEAGLDQLTKANTRFQSAGTVRSIGSKTDAEAKTRASTPPPPTAGAVIDGYRFKGGNPADQKNWEKQ